MDFPASLERPVEAPVDLMRALGVEAKYVGKNVYDYLVEVETEEMLRGLKPDFTSLKSIPGIRGVIVTSRSAAPEYDFVSRFFAPGSGVDEDPVTGSAHCCLGPFWGERLGKTAFVAYQASPRGGIVHVRLGGDRVYLGGQAVTILRGELL
jgi:predicted PhzF superfamily epimerase YddE/YHI9